MSELIVMIGAPGSGKSTLGKSLAETNGYVYLSSDENRARVGNGEEDQKASARAFALLRLETEQALKDGKTVVVDACFVSKKARYDFVKIGRTLGVHLKAISFELPREVILERHDTRVKNGGRSVPRFVIDKMLKNYEAPTMDEFDEVQFVRQ